jgi:hypothetical protein
MKLRLLLILKASIRSSEFGSRSGQTLPSLKEKPDNLTIISNSFNAVNLLHLSDVINSSVILDTCNFRKYLSLINASNISLVTSKLGNLKSVKFGLAAKTCTTLTSSTLGALDANFVKILWATKSGQIYINLG